MSHPVCVSSCYRLCEWFYRYSALLAVSLATRRSCHRDKLLKFGTGFDNKTASNDIDIAGH